MNRRQAIIWNQWCRSLMRHKCVTRPWWVNTPWSSNRLHFSKVPRFSMDKLYEKWIYFYVVNVSAWKNNMEYKYMFMFPQNLSTHHVVPRVQLKNKLWFTTLCELMKGGFSAFHLCRCKLHSSYSCIVCYQLGESSAWGMRCFHPRSNTNYTSASSSQTCYPRNYNRTGSHIGISSNVMTPQTHHHHHHHRAFWKVPPD